MRHLATLLICIFLTGCANQAEVDSPTESEKQMLQCKDNLREYESLLQHPQRPSKRGRSRGKTSPKALPTGVPGCPAAAADTYSESYDPKTGEIYCKGHHHQKVGLEENYPRLVANATKNPEKATSEKKRRRQPDRNFAPNVKENASGITPIPSGFPLPLDAPVEILSSTVGRKDGVFHTFLRYDGDLAEIEQKWRTLLNSQVHNPSIKDNVSVGGSTPLASRVSANIDLETHIIRVTWEPAFLINDLE
jgi:hypothetical protein